MGSRPTYEIIGTYIYTFSRIDHRLASLAARLNADDHRGSELLREFSQVAAEMSTLKDDRDAVLDHGNIPDEATALAYVERCNAARAKIEKIEAIVFAQP